jgi:hypothetical protein
MKKNDKILAGILLILLAIVLLSFQLVFLYGTTQPPHEGEDLGYWRLRVLLHFFTFVVLSDYIILQVRALLPTLPIFKACQNKLWIKIPLLVSRFAFLIIACGSLGIQLYFLIKALGDGRGDIDFWIVAATIVLNFWVCKYFFKKIVYTFIKKEESEDE